MACATKVVFLKKTFLMYNPCWIDIFFLLRTFVFILVVFYFVVVFLTTFRPNFTSSFLQVINRDPKDFFGLINQIICSPYLVFPSRVRTKFVIVFIGIFLRWSFLIWELIFLLRTFVFILVDFFSARPIKALSLYCSRRALSEDSGFNSYPSQPEVYLVKNVVR